MLILTQSILGTFNNLWSSASIPSTKGGLELTPVADAAALVSQVLRPFRSLSTPRQQPPQPRRRSSTPSIIVMPGRRWSTHRRGSVTAVCYSPKSDCDGLLGPLDPLDDPAPAPLPERKDEGTGMGRLQESEDEPEEGEEVGLKPDVVQVECTDTRRSGAPLSVRLALY